MDRNELLIRRRFGQFSRQISGYALQRLLPEYGYNVAALLSGSEGGLAATLRATVRLSELPKAKVLCVLGFGDSISSADCVPIVLRHHPLTMESINSDLVERLPSEVRDAAVRAGLPAGKAWLLVEMGGDDEVLAARAAQAMLDELRDSAPPTTSTDPSSPAAGSPAAGSSAAASSGAGVGSGSPAAGSPATGSSGAALFGAVARLGSVGAGRLRRPIW